MFSSQVFSIFYTFEINIKKLFQANIFLYKQTKPDSFKKNYSTHIYICKRNKLYLLLRIFIFNHIKKLN